MATHVSTAKKLDTSNLFVRKKSMTTNNNGALKTMIDCGEFGLLVTDEPVARGRTGEDSSPLQKVLGALCGCESATFNRTAQDFDFKYNSIDFEAMYTIDFSGCMGEPSVQSHFQTVRVQATVTTDESEERLREVVEETEVRCPVLNRLKDAQVKFEMQWGRRSPR